MTTSRELSSDSPKAMPLPGGASRSTYRGFLVGRWGPRAELLGLHAAVGNVALFLIDVAHVHLGLSSAPLGYVAAVRLPWIALPIAGGLLARFAPNARALPISVIGLSVCWTWAMDWAYLALGLGDSNVRAMVVLLCIVTAATFLPIRIRGRIGVFTLMAVGHVGVGAYAKVPTGPQLLDAFVLIALVAVQTAIFEGFGVSQRRRFILHKKLLQKLKALEASERRAQEAAMALGRLAARVAHEINSPLAAVKVNIRWLSEYDDPSERGEVIADTLAAVDHIARSVRDLEAPAVTPAPSPRPGR